MCPVKGNAISDHGADNNDDREKNVQVVRHDIHDWSHVEQDVKSQQPSQQSNGRFDSRERRDRQHHPAVAARVAGRAMALDGGDGQVTVGLVGFNAS